TLGRRELPLSGEVVPGLAQPALAHEELRRGCGGGGRVRDAAGHAVVPGDPLVAPHHDLGLPGSVRPDPIDVNVPAVLDAEQEVVAVPDGLADVGIWAALAVERVGENQPLAARDGNDRDLPVARVV